MPCSGLSDVRVVSDCLDISTTETLRLIARTSQLASAAPPADLDAIKRHASLAAAIQADILDCLSARAGEDEEGIAARSFLLAAHLYFLTSIHRSSLDHSSVVWTTQQLVNLLALAKANHYRQGWATWPYFILGLHVTKPQHRQRVSERFRWLEATLSVGNLSTLKTCLEKLWRARDRGDDISWQECADKHAKLTAV